MNTRDSYIDFLRFLGLILIILAHVNTPNIIYQIRSFDVPLMLFVSGLSYSSKVINPQWNTFFWPRVKKLVIPIYCFLIVDFIAFAILKAPFPKIVVFRSLLFNVGNAVGYVWIIKVFLLIMLVTPLLIKINNKISDLCFLLLLISLICLQEIYARFFMDMVMSKTILDISIHETIPYLIGYSIPFLLGLRMRKMSQVQTIYSTIILIMITAIGIWLFYTGTHSFVQLSTYYKYPPRAPFIIYGMSLSALLWALKPLLKGITNRSLINFIGQNTIWIYVWHIAFVSIVNIYFNSWVLKFCLVLIGSVSVYFVQYNLVRSKTKYQSNFLKYFIG